MNNNLDKLKEEYYSIKADDKLKERLANTMKNEKRKSSNIKKLIGVAACFGVITVSLNVSPDFAYAMSKIPVVDSIVKVLTLNKYEVDGGNYQAEIVTPKIEGLLDKELENKLNAEFEENAQQVIAAFESTIKEMEETAGEGNFHQGLEYNYTVKTDNEDILALDVYLFEVKASGYERHTFYNINKKTGDLIEFNSLFKDGADYKTPIDKYILSEMERLNAEEGGMFFIGDDIPTGGFETIGDNPKFYINNDGNSVICFDEYEVAAGAQGSPEFVIPNDVVADILK